jgi:selenocysteine lyase/cysteine desulfurase
MCHAGLCAIATVSVERCDPKRLKLALRRRGINTSVSICEHALLDMRVKGIKSALRVSPHYYNTREEIDSMVEATREALTSSELA